MTMPADSDYTGPDAAARELVAELSGLLAEFSSQCVIIGGVARNYWLEPRFTKDIDFELVADPAIFGKLRRRMEAAGYEIARLLGADEPSGPGFARFVKPGTSKIVEFLTAKTEFEQMVIDRREPVGPGEPLAVATPEDIVVLKLIANRPIDHADVIDLGQIEGLDWEWVRRWCAEFDISDRLQGLQLAIEQERKRISELLGDAPDSAPAD